MALQKVPVRLYLEYCPGRASPRKRNYRGLQGRSEKKGVPVKRGLEDLGLFSVKKQTVKRRMRIH